MHQTAVTDLLPLLLYLTTSSSCCSCRYSSEVTDVPVLSAMRRPAQANSVPGKDLELAESVQQRLIRTGEFDRLKQVLEQRLTECGWREDVKQRCREVAKTKGVDNITVADLVNEVKPHGRSSVPDNIKAELLTQLRTFLAE